jgi:uncharacterized protein YjbI with pentapeptide repeats
MANAEHVRLLRKGPRTGKVIKKRLDLSGAALAGINLHHVHLDYANFSEANLDGANLSEASFRRAIFTGASLKSANLESVDFSHAHLATANLTNARATKALFIGSDLTRAILNGAILRRATLGYTEFLGTELQNADFTNAYLQEVMFVNVNLATVVGLETCSHGTASTIDFRTLQKSGSLPLPFLRGIGLPENLISYLPSLLNHAFQFYSCFVSYSTHNQPFVDHLHADLQNSGVRCWFAPHDMPIGGKILDEIDSAIRLRDKVLLVLSTHSIQSDWVEDEVTKAFEEERKRGQTVLFPIRLDDAVMDTNEAWAAKLRARHIGDFRRWKEHDEYQKSFARVLRDLMVKEP